MKNIHLLPTHKPSRLTIRLKTDELMYSYKEFVNQKYEDIPLNQNQHIYITSDEEIKEGDWVVKISSLYKGGGNVQKYSFIDSQFEDITFKKIILTTDPDLIADGVQAIDDEFLQWFVKNPSCESVEVEKRYSDFTVDPFVGYKIIIPQEEPKQETLEEAADNWVRQPIIGTKRESFIAGYKLAQERMYSEEEVMDMFDKFSMHLPLHYEFLVREMFKKK
jgi:hypothetical protein